MHKHIFKETLYKEHLEEAGFHYETRLAWLGDKTISWVELERLDSAIEAHLDALVLGSQYALKVALEYAPDAEPGELHIIVRLFCRHQLIDRLSKLWLTFDFDNSENIQAVADALKWECPTNWQDKLAKVFTSKNQKMYAIVAPSMATLSPHLTAVLLTALANSDASHTKILLDTIAQSNLLGANDAIYNIINQSQDKQTLKAAIRCLLIRQDTAILTHFENRLEDFAILFAIAGDKKHSQTLIHLAKNKTVEAETLLAIALTGNLEAVPILLNYLKHPTLNQDAAQALHIISGAALYEEQHAPEKIDEDELFEHEMADLKKGIHPKNIDGIDYGIEEKVLSVDYHIWFSWLQNNKARFIKNERYRYGSILSEKTLVNALIQPELPRTLRNIIYDELVIKYKVTLPFFSDDLIHKQKMQLNALYTHVN